MYNVRSGVVGSIIVTIQVYMFISFSVQESLVAIVQAIKSTSNLPAAGEDHDFYYSFSDFREFRTAQGARLLSK